MAAPEHIQCFFQGLAYQSSPQNKFLWNCRLGFQEFQDYFVNAGISQGSILGPTLHLPYINDLPDDGVCSIATYADDITFYCEYEQSLDLWQQLKLASEIGYL